MSRTTDTIISRKRINEDVVSPESHDVVPVGVDPDSKVAHFSFGPHHCLAVGPIHLPPEPLVVVQFLADLKHRRVTTRLILWTMSTKSRIKEPRVLPAFIFPPSLSEEYMGSIPTGTAFFNFIRFYLSSSFPDIMHSSPFFQSTRREIGSEMHRLINLR